MAKIQLRKMDINRIVIAVLGAAASFVLVLPEIRKMNYRKFTAEKLKMIGEALREAEDRVIRHEQRHDRLLYQLCSHYIINQNLEDALIGARDAMNEASELAVVLRKLQTEIISSYLP